MRLDTQPLRPIDGVATIYPVDIRNALVAAGQRRDMDLIDMLTDSLARQGLCRPRRDDVIQPGSRITAGGLAG